MIVGKKHVGFRVKMNFVRRVLPFSTVSRKLHPSVCSPIRPYKRKPRQKAREIVAVYKREKRTNEPTRPPLPTFSSHISAIFLPGIMRGNTGIPYGHRWAEANRFPFFRPVSIFNGAENRRVFHRFKPRAFHPPLVRLILPFSETIAREEGENSHVRRLQLLAIFRKRFESLCEEKFVKAMKILIRHGPTDACRVHCLYCAGTIVVISHASLSFTLSLRLSSYFYAPRKNFANESSSLRYFIPLSLLGKKFDWGRGEGGALKAG